MTVGIRGFRSLVSRVAGRVLPLQRFRFGDQGFGRDFFLSPPTTLDVGIVSSTFVDLRRAFNLVVLAAVVGIPVACGGGRLVASQLFDTRRLWFSSIQFVAGIVPAL